MEHSSLEGPNRQRPEFKLLSIRGFARQSRVREAYRESPSRIYIDSSLKAKSTLSDATPCACSVAESRPTL